MPITYANRGRDKGEKSSGSKSYGKDRNAKPKPISYYDRLKNQMSNKPTGIQWVADKLRAAQEQARQYLELAGNLNTASQWNMVTPTGNVTQGPIPVLRSIRSANHGTAGAWQ